MNMSPLLPDNVARDLALKLSADQLVLFVGAGISHQARAKDGSSKRMPLWQELAAKVGRAHGESVDNYGGNLLDMFDGIDSSHGRRALEDAVREVIDDDAFEPAAPHRLIASLPWHRVYTTNYDSLLGRAMEENDPIVDETGFEKLRRPAIERPRLIHLHGDLSNMHTLTAEDYTLWDEKHPIAKANLTEDGLNKTFLFIGYSNSDPHLRLGLFPWILKAGRGRQGRNHAWMWNATEQQIKVFDRVNRIAVTSIADDGGWEAFLRQLQQSFDQLRSRRPRRTRLQKQENRADSEAIHINGYKLFYHRTMKRMSVNDLARMSVIDYGRIRRMERVSKSAVPGPSCFALSSRREISRLEDVLGCRGVLEYGSGDDFLATYIMYYKVNSGRMAKKGSNRQLSFVPETKAVVFDFGGTLTLPKPPYNTWERMWLSAGYGIEEAADLHRRFSAGKIDHQTWCDLTRDRLRDRGFSRDDMERIADDIRPVPGLAETLEILNQRNIPTYIVSGSLRYIIVKLLGSAFSLVNGIKCNDIIFDKDGLVSEIRGHDFDFEGKAKYISTIVEERKCEPLEVLFIGNSLNDHWAIRSGARTLCVNPSHTDFTNGMVWSNYIREMTDLSQILKHV
jgi:phosphoserine phosphatase/NAD-dependent SIR2 family protein deacetylase